MEIVPVTNENAADGGRIIYEAWGETYRGLMPDDILDGRQLDKCIERAHMNMENKALCYVDGEAAGTIVTLTEARDFCTYGDSGEIVALYVLKKFQHMGIGKALIQWGIEHLKAIGKTRITLFVLKGNDNAVGFYKHMGFEFTGHSIEDRGMTDFEMVLADQKGADKI